MLDLNGLIQLEIKVWPLKTGDCLIHLAFKAGSTVSSFENSVDPDQLASSEASRSGFTLFTH